MVVHHMSGWPRKKNGGHIKSAQMTRWNHMSGWPRKKNGGHIKSAQMTRWKCLC